MVPEPSFVESFNKLSNKFLKSSYPNSWSVTLIQGFNNKMEIDLCREKLKYTFYETSISKKQKTKN